MDGEQGDQLVQLVLKVLPVPSIFSSRSIPGPLFPDRAFSRAPLFVCHTFLPCSLPFLWSINVSSELKLPGDMYLSTC